MSEICICAAIKFADGRIVRGHRHDGCFTYAAGWIPKPDRTGHEQGFMTSENRFVGREVAMELQLAAGKTQPSGAPLVGNILFSEDLY